METRTSDKKNGYLFLLIFCYIVSRLPIFLSHTETIHLELYRGTLAKELWAGLTLPWGDYLADAYAMAPLFNALLTLPFFLLFGENLFALKFVPFLWHFFSLLAWFWIWRSCFGAKQAFWISLLFIFAPPQILQYTVSNHGTHFEMILWTALAVVFLKKTIEGDWTPLWGGLWLGLIGGFSSALILTNLVTVAMAWIYSVLSRQKKVFYLIYLFGFLIGFSPMLYHNWTHDWMGVAKIPQFFYHWNLQSLSDHFRLLFLKTDTGLSGLFGFWPLNNLRGKILTIGYLCFYLFSLIFLFYRKWGFWKQITPRFDGEVFGLLYSFFFLFLMLYATAGWGLHYAFPLVPFIGMTLVRGAFSLGPALRRVLLGYCLLAGIIGNVVLIHPGRMSDTKRIQGFSYADLAEVLEYNFGTHADLFWQKSDQLLKDKDMETKKVFYRRFTDEILTLKTHEDVLKQLSRIHSRETFLQPILYEKLGTQLGLFLNFDPLALAQTLQKYSIEEVFHSNIYLGFVLSLNRLDLEGPALAQRGLILCEKIPVSGKPSCYKGLGVLADPGFWQAKRAIHSSVVSKIPKSYHIDYFHGLGRYWTSIWVEQPKSVEDFLELLDSKEREWFFEGIRRELSLVEDPWKREQWLKKLKKVTTSYSY